MRMFLSILMLYIPLVIYLKILVEWPWLILLIGSCVLLFISYKKRKNKATN